MRNLQAWGWLVAGVVALGLNGISHDREAELVQRVAERVSERSAALVERVTGQADPILAEVRAEVQMIAAHDETASCRLSEVLARAQAMLARSQGEFAHFEAMSARQEAQLADFEANREQIEQQVDEQVTRLRIASVAVAPVRIRVVCPRVRVNVPVVRIAPLHVHAVTMPRVNLPQL
jgi:hypothetical protein